MEISLAYTVSCILLLRLRIYAEIAVNIPIVYRHDEPRYPSANAVLARLVRPPGPSGISHDPRFLVEEGEAGVQLLSLVRTPWSTNVVGVTNS
ncbi:hypothetical protein OG21DRAFT_1051376 [Imleria badia]|nr:hypothetical protein OG21DRAFT_1051376 [Imleria badia]